MKFEVNLIIFVKYIIKAIKIFKCIYYLLILFFFFLIAYGWNKYAIIRLQIIMQNKIFMNIIIRNRFNIYINV